MEARWPEGAKGAAEEGGAGDEARGWVCCGEDWIEDCGEVDAVEWGGGGSHDDGGGMRKSVADGFGCERAGRNKYELLGLR